MSFLPVPNQEFWTRVNCRLPGAVSTMPNGRAVFRRQTVDESNFKECVTYLCAPECRRRTSAFNRAVGDRQTASGTDAAWLAWRTFNYLGALLRCSAAVAGFRYCLEPVDVLRRSAHNTRDNKRSDGRRVRYEKWQ